MKNTNITLAMVAVLAAVTMLSAGLAVPMHGVKETAATAVIALNQTPT